MKLDHRKTYWKAWVTLLIMTVIMVWMSFHSLSAMTVVAVVAVASIQAALVALFFMHLKYDNKANAVTFVLSLLFLGIFAGLTASDMLDRDITEPVKVAEVGKGARQLPIRVAIDLMAASDPSPAPAIRKSVLPSDSEGSRIYRDRCAACHGASGQGGIKVRVLGSNPFGYLSTVSLQEFIRINSEGLPGFGKPGISDLTPAQWQALYEYVQQLAGVR